MDVDRCDVAPLSEVGLVSLRRRSSRAVSSGLCASRRALLRPSVRCAAADRLAFCALGLVVAALCAAWAIASGTCIRGDDGLYSGPVL